MLLPFWLISPHSSKFYPYSTPITYINPTLHPRPPPLQRFPAPHWRHGLRYPTSVHDDNERVHGVLPSTFAAWSPTQRALPGVLFDAVVHVRRSTDSGTPSGLDQHHVAGLLKTRPNRRHQHAGHYDVSQSSKVYLPPLSIYLSILYCDVILVEIVYVI